MKYKAWVVLVTGFTIATMQIIGMFIAIPTKSNLFNVIVMFIMFSCAAFVIPRR